MKMVFRHRTFNNFGWWLIAATLMALVFPAHGQSQPRLSVVYPKEGDEIFAPDSTFVFGHVFPRKAPVYVNGIRARKYKNGTFMVMVPVQPGDFRFHCISIWKGDTTAVDRRIAIPAFLQTGPTDTLGIDTTYIFPSRPMELQPGDKVTFLMKGTPGQKAFVTLTGVTDFLPMVELRPRKPFYWGEAVFGQDRPPRIPEVKGIYAATYIIQQKDPPGAVPIQFTLQSPDGRSQSYISPATLTILKTDVPRVGLLQQPMTIGRTAPGKGYQYFLPEGVRLWITGRDGDYYRVRLAADEETWVPVSAVRLLPEGTPPPSSEIMVARTQNFPDRARIKLFLQERLPFGVEQSARPQKLILRLYGAVSNTDWIRHDFIDPYVGEIQWRQEKTNVYKLIIHLNTLQQWGYRVYYEGTNLFLEVRKPPRFTGGRRKPLKGMLICVDPGHGPDDGALGPTGLTEKEATLLYARTLKDMLERKGAVVFLTRDDNQGINLASRTKIAEAIEAHLFISIHFNALPDGVNPFISRGTSTYYYHTQSYPLAKFVQKQLLRKTKLPNFGLYYDNLAVCRITWMPSVLVEPAFIMHPLEEMRTLDAGFRRAVCEGIVKGVLDFVKQARAE